MRLAKLDDPSNPYAGMYDEWDVWAYDILAAQDEIELYGPGTFRLLTLEESAAGVSNAEDVYAYCVDENDCLIPAVEDIRLFEEEYRTKQPNTRTRAKHIVVRGELDPELHQAKLRAMDAVRAGAYPSIPVWLGEHPPVQVTLIPNGDFVCWGPLGALDRSISHSDDRSEGEDAGGHGHGFEDFYIYSADGTLKARTERHWWFAYYGLDRERPEGRMDESVKGLFRFHDEDGKLLSQWSWDGTELALDAGPPPVSAYDFLTLTGQTVARYYELRK